MNNNTTLSVAPISMQSPMPSQVPLQVQWTYFNNQTGTLNTYPRPQGNLPMLEWALKTQAKEELLTQYQNVMKF